jgi:bifunctional DNA-binding transcriptional regulator/antitoxin component of YhaV-PrlF toxin-antitoxin module
VADLTQFADARTLKLTAIPGRAKRMTKTLTSAPIVVPEAVRRKAGLRRGDKVAFRVSGRSITIIPEGASREDYPLETVTRLIKQAKKNPMSPAELRTESRRLMAYGSRQAKKVGIKERDITRVIHESRSRRRSS